ncbi:MAG: hypothetical protein N2169_07735, partial [bacterium]|nr:hypothetical protein [bacterium]
DVYKRQPIEGLIMEYISLRGREGKEKMDTTVITEIANYMRDVMRIEIPERQPFVGKNFNVTKAGIHADGMLKNEEIYNIFDTKKVLNRPIAVGITDKSGTAGIVYWINSNLKIPDNEKITKDNTYVIKIKEAIDKEFEEGRIVGISDEEMIEYVKKFLPDIYNKYGQNYKR